MQEISYELTRLTQAVSDLASDMAAVKDRAEALAERLDCRPPAGTAPPSAVHPLRRRNFKDALEVVLEMRENVSSIERLMAEIERAASTSAASPP